jgi:hypothetical protein
METSTKRSRQWRLNNPEAYKTNRKEWCDNNTRKVNDHKCSIGCKFCGYNKYGGALEWHHPNGDKEYIFRTSGYFGPKATAERAKCILLCSNCHREEHYKMKTRPDLDDLWKPSKN